MGKIERIHDKLSYSQRKSIPLKRLQNNCDNFKKLAFAISMLKGKKGARQMRRQLYSKELLPKCRKFIKRLEEILPKVKQHCSVIQSMLIDEYFSRFTDKVLMLEHRFTMAP